MQVQDVMTRRVKSLGPNATVQEAALRMREGKIGSIPVVENGRVLGMVTDRDLALRVVADWRATRDMPVHKVMSEGCYTVQYDDDVGQAAEMMTRHQVKRLPVLNADDRLVGIVTLGDLGREVLDAATEALAGISEPNDQPRR